MYKMKRMRIGKGDLTKNQSFTRGSTSENNNVIF